MKKATAKKRVRKASRAETERTAGRRSGDAPGARRRVRATIARAPQLRTRGVVIAGLAVLVAAVFHVWTGLRVAELGYERSRAIELGQRLEAQRQRLGHELASLQRTAFLEEEAARRLGLLPPSAGQVVDLRPEQFASAPRRSVP